MFLTDGILTKVDEVINESAFYVSNEKPLEYCDFLMEATSLETNVYENYNLQSINESTVLLEGVMDRFKKDKPLTGKVDTNGSEPTDKPKDSVNAKFKSADESTKKPFIGKSKDNLQALKEMISRFFDTIAAKFKKLFDADNRFMKANWKKMKTTTVEVSKEWMDNMTKMASDCQSKLSAKISFNEKAVSAFNSTSEFISSQVEKLKGSKGGQKVKVTVDKIAELYNKLKPVVENDLEKRKRDCMSEADSPEKVTFAKKIIAIWNRMIAKIQSCLGDAMSIIRGALNKGGEENA